MTDVSIMHKVAPYQLHDKSFRRAYAARGSTDPRELDANRPRVQAFLVPGPSLLSNGNFACSNRGKNK